MISVETRRIESSDPSLPALALQVIELVESYMIWVGVARGSAEDAVQSGNLGKDWACAMPSLSPNNTLPAPATTLSRTSSSDAALSMAQRLAKRFRKQVFVSVDIPDDRQGLKMLLEAEKGIVGRLKELEQQ